MDINNLMETLTAALADDASISDWAASEYGRSHKVFENIDMREPPDKDDCPLVAVRPDTKTGGLNHDGKEHILVFGFLVLDDERPVDAHGVIRFKGGRQAEEFRKLAFSVIENNIPADGHIMEVETEYDTISQFPYIFVNMTVLITEPKTIGTDPFE